RVVDRGEVDVALGYTTNTTVDDAQLHRIVDLDLEQRLLECLDGTGDVTLDDEVERLDLAVFEGLGEVLEADALAAAGEQRVALCCLTLLGDLAGHTVVVGDQEGVTGARHRGEPEHGDRTSRCCLLDGCPVLVEHRTNTSVRGSGHDGVS